MSRSRWLCSVDVHLTTICTSQLGAADITISKGTKRGSDTAFKHLVHIPPGVAALEIWTVRGGYQLHAHQTLNIHALNNSSRTGTTHDRAGDVSILACTILSHTTPRSSSPPYPAETMIETRHALAVTDVRICLCIKSKSPK